MVFFKKHFILLIAVVISFISGSLFFLYPQTSLSILDKSDSSQKNSNDKSSEKLSFQSQETTSNDKQSQPEPHNEKESYDDRKIAEWTAKVRQWVGEFPFPQETTRSILGANPDNVQQALEMFNQRLQDEIINNNALSKNEKSHILWDIYTNTTWLGDSNALEAIVQDHLASMTPFDLTDEIRATYQTWASSGNKTLESRHDLLEIVDGILNVDGNTLNNSAKQQYVKSILSAKELLLDQIKMTNESDEAQNLTGFAIDLYASHATSNEMEELSSTIQAISASNPENSLQLYHSTLKNLLSQPKNSDQATRLMLASPSPDLNQSLTFLLKEDGNIALADIPPTTRTELLTYLQSQENSIRGTDIEPDWKLSISRLQNGK